MKLDQLIGFFGCKFREGRAAAAPQLRREGLKVFDAAEVDGIHSFKDAVMHDPDVLPHMYAVRDIENMFPNIVAPALEGFGEDDPDGPEPELRDPMREAQECEYIDRTGWSGRSHPPKPR